MSSPASVEVTAKDVRKHFLECLRSSLTWAVILIPPLMKIGDVHHAPAASRLELGHGAFYLTGIALFVGFMLTIGAELVSAALMRNMSYTLVLAACWAIGSLLYTMLKVVVFPSEGGIDHQIVHWMVEQIVAVAALLILVLHNRDRIQALVQRARLDQGAPMHRSSRLRHSSPMRPRSSPCRRRTNMSLSCVRPGPNWSGAALPT